RQSVHHHAITIRRIRHTRLERKPDLFTAQLLRNRHLIHQRPIHPITALRSCSIKRELLRRKLQLPTTRPGVTTVLVAIFPPVPAMTVKVADTPNRSPVSPHTHMSGPRRNKLASFVSRTVTAREVLAVPLPISAREPCSKQILSRVIISHKPWTGERELPNNRIRNLTHGRNHAISDCGSRRRNNHACKLQMRVSDRSRLGHAFKKQ